MPGPKSADTLVCPLCGEPLPTARSSCVDCGTPERPTGKAITVVTVVRDYVLDEVHVDRQILQPQPAAVPPKRRRWFFREARPAKAR